MDKILPRTSPQLSVIVPAYNESATILQIIDKLRGALSKYSLEILVVDDGSTDGTGDLIRRLTTQDGIHPLFHAANRGKGAAFRTALEQVHGAIIVVQDADLEYDPTDIPRLIQPIIDGMADVVYGSRFHGNSQRIHLFWHRVANGGLTLLSNMLNNINLSDMEVGYKAFRKEVLEGLCLREDGFGFEPEITAKIAKRKYRIFEVPISYAGRDYAEGKKIGLKDALRALWCIVRYRIAD